jgi:hypothetical protein
MNVIDLALVLSSVRRGSYFISETGLLFSKISSLGPKVLVSFAGGGVAYLAQLRGTKTVSGRYFSFEPTHSGCRLTYHESILKRNRESFAVRNPNAWKFGNSAPATVEVKPCSAQPIEFCVIAKIVNGAPVFSSSPKVHTSLHSGKVEALRLAKEYPGTKFSVFTIKTSVTAKSEVWE